MSRIILAKYPGTDESHIVVGWDRSLSTYYWQEFNKEPEVTYSKEKEKWQVTSPAHKVCVYDSQLEAKAHKWDDWEEMLGYAGYMPNELPTLHSLWDSAPVKVRGLLTPEVQQTLREHSMSSDPNVIIDMTPQSYKIEVQTLDSGERWSSNALRFATMDEAEAAARDLANRWLMVKEHRVTTSRDPVNYKWEDGKAVSVATGA